MDKVDIIKSLYEELTTEEKSRICHELLNGYAWISDKKEEFKSVDFYSKNFIEFVSFSNYLRHLVYEYYCGKINEIKYLNEYDQEHIFKSGDEAYKYWEKYFDNRMKMKYTEDSDEYQCFEIISLFDFYDVEEQCKKLGYTIGLDNKTITRYELIKDAVEMLRTLCSKEDATFRQIGRLQALKVVYPKEEGGNYFSLMYCIEQVDNAY